MESHFSESGYTVEFSAGNELYRLQQKIECMDKKIDDLTKYIDLFITLSMDHMKKTNNL